MKSFLFVITLFFVSFESLADMKELETPYQVDSIVEDKSLQNNESVIHILILNQSSFNLHARNKAHSSVVYAINSGENKTVSFGSFEPQVIKEHLPPGTYSFQLFLNEQHLEMTIPDIRIKEKQRIYLSCTFERNENARIPIQCEKPVIYLYPEQKREVAIKVNPTGDLIFSYPVYENGWNVTANPSGEIEMKGKTYNYLFWESEFESKQNSIQPTNGFLVEQENSISFLEEQLAQFGLTSKEQADFITYWAPRMMKNQTNFVRFSLNEECDKYAHLDISPRPDNIYRIYIEFLDVTNLEDFTEIKPQKISPINRTGFTVIEWGGVDFGIVKETISQIKHLNSSPFLD